MAKIKTNKDYLTLNQELEEIIRQLQAENTTIDDALRLYGRGMALVKEVNAYLQTARNQLKRIAADVADR